MYKIKQRNPCIRKVCAVLDTWDSHHLLKLNYCHYWHWNWSPLSLQYCSIEYYVVLLLFLPWRENSCCNLCSGHGKNLGVLLEFLYYHPFDCYYLVHWLECPCGKGNEKYQSHFVFSTHGKGCHLRIEGYLDTSWNPDGYCVSVVLEVPRNWHN